MGSILNPGNQGSPEPAGRAAPKSDVVPRRLSLRSRLLIVLLLLGWLPLLILLPLQYRVLDQNLNAHLTRNLIELSGVQQRRINRELERLTGNLDLVASRTQMRISLDAFNRTERAEHQEFVTRVLADVFEANANLVGVWVFSPSDALVGAAGASGQLDATGIFDQLPEHDGLRMGPYWSETCARSYWLGTALELEGRKIGRLLLALNLDGLMEVLNDFPDPAFIGRSHAILERFDGARCVLEASGSIDTGEVGRRPAEAELLELLDRLMPGQPTSTPGHNGVDDATWMKLPLGFDSGYLLIQSVPRLKAEMRAVLLTGYGAILLLVFTLATLGSLWAARQITAPLAGLVDQMMAFRRGEKPASLDAQAWPQELNDLHDALQQTVESQRRAFSALRREVRQRRRAQSQLLDLANTDELTGLANRRYLIQRIAEQIESSSSKNAALLYMDLDRFKPVNDRYGHHVGDEVLRTVGKRLINVLRQQDLPARMGGDEFAVLLSGNEQRVDVGEISDRIESAISQPITVGKITVSLGASIGHVELANCYTVQEILQRADAAMYRVKRSRGYRRA